MDSIRPVTIPGSNTTEYTKPPAEWQGKVSAGNPRRLVEKEDTAAVSQQSFTSATSQQEGLDTKADNVPSLETTLTNSVGFRSAVVAKVEVQPDSARLQSQQGVQGDSIGKLEVSPPQLARDDTPSESAGTKPPTVGEPANQSTPADVVVFVDNIDIEPSPSESHDDDAQAPVGAPPQVVSEPETVASFEVPPAVPVTLLIPDSQQPAKGSIVSLFSALRRPSLFPEMRFPSLRNDEKPMPTVSSDSTSRFALVTLPPPKEPGFIPPLWHPAIPCLGRTGTVIKFQSGPNMNAGQKAKITVQHGILAYKTALTLTVYAESQSKKHKQPLTSTDMLALKTDTGLFQIIDATTLRPPRHPRLRLTAPGTRTCLVLLDPSTHVPKWRWGGLCHVLQRASQLHDKYHLQLFTESSTHPRGGDLVCALDVRGSQPLFLPQVVTTTNYLVLIVCPTRWAKFGTDLAWDVTGPTYFYIVDRKSKKHMATYRGEPMHFVHVVNAFDMAVDTDTEWSDVDIVVDVCASRSPVAVSAPTTTEFDGTELASPNQDAAATAIGGSRPRTESGRKPIPLVRYDVRSGPGIELPVTNPNFQGKASYQYIYGVRVTAPGMAATALVKINVQHRASMEWQVSGCLPGGPVVVPRPGASTEDDAVVLSVVLDTMARRSFVLVLDAQSFREVARVSLGVGQIMPFAFHGIFVQSPLPKNENEVRRIEGRS
ncbi:retinal pigment epithelial membrane protein-domain-containing protein [Catenaria anguillulae PL171]|uniref:Retinal pigment epithelial membrane protein-domain-containing protein n=1 Tax=Catenaria anguillulae PL171 TaxID=765915 RepID=A0A1Y2I2Q1_9FUNG|nr:retinal pigment epithelial membrane protein-domain-containing protein [Catenaria anguillulae PL171]